MFNKKKIEKYVRKILEEIDPNPDREGLVETPKRVAKMYCEVFEGQKYTNDEIAAMYDKCFPCEANDLVVEKDIPCFSYCEHHMALMYDMKVAVAYIPRGKVIGISKLARIADMVGKRLQLQERIGSDIAEIVQKITGSEDVAVLIEGCHSCMTARGIQKTNSKTVTSTLRGRFRKDAALQNRLFLQR